MIKSGDIEKLVKKKMEKIRLQWWKEIETIGLTSIITQTIMKGISPVMGSVARLKKYSQSYLDAITGKSAWITTKGGGKIKLESLSTDELKSYRADKQAKKDNANTKQLIKEIAEKRFNGKKKSPVNMFLTGTMLSSLRWDKTKGTLIADDPKWDWHNDGVPENNLPERRLLPNRKGEMFNRLIQGKIVNALKKSTGKNSRELKKLLSVNFKIK